MIDYQQFLATKRLTIAPVGIEVETQDINPILFPFQRVLVQWSARKGRAALFCDTGLGKTFMQLEWARLLGKRTLIVAPLSVGRQTVAEGARLGIEVHKTRSGGDVADGINITNYEMLDHFDAAAFGAVVLDESSILKSLDGKTRKKLTEMFARTPYRLCCTATPAPNDIAEIANHAEFLGIMSRADMLATFFVHDDAGWRLKGHASGAFYRWLASWGMSIRMPSDLGFADDGYILPALSIEPVFVDVDYTPPDRLFFTELKGVQERHTVRRATLGARVAAAVDLVNSSDEQWIVWHGLNEEGYALKAVLGDAVLVEGSDSLESKAAAIEGFQDGQHRVLITKPKIAGFGLNFQHCRNMVFVGLSDSWEAYYQCIRRCYRFGQDRPVNVYIVLSEAERAIHENIKRKEREAQSMSAHLIDNVQEFERSEIAGTNSDYSYTEDRVTGDGYTLMLGDSAEKLGEIASESVGLSVFSPPFMSLFTYSPTERDLGNSKGEAEFFSHFGYIIRELLRVTKPGRNCAVHVSQVPATLNTHGYIGLIDFRGRTIDAFREEGWTYHGEVCVDKDPQVQAIRTHSKGLLFVQLRKDSSWLRPALADYILVFRKPGENEQPITPDLTNDEWIEWARPVWYGIKETDTLNTAVAKENADERHICPLQLGTIERCIRLWSNPGDLVLSPFAGIGSEGYEALRLGRQFVGIELKPSYFRTAATNLERAVQAAGQPNFLHLLTEQADDPIPISSAETMDA